VALPWGLLVAVGIDLVIDGLLVGLGATLGSKQGLVLTVALTIEIRSCSWRCRSSRSCWSRASPAPGRRWSPVRSAC